MLGTLKFIKDTNEHVWVKKVFFLKDSSVFDIMLHSPNDEALVIDSPF